MLRQYQSDTIARLRAGFRAGRRALLLVAPTGAGKTVMFASMTGAAVAKRNRVLILVHRQELIDQVARAVAHLPHGIIAAGRMTDPQALVQIASVQTVVNRLGKIHPPDLIVIDEAHHASATTWATVLEAFPNAWRLGVTATPQRLDGKGLSDLFEDIVVGPTVPELQSLGFLCGTRYFAPANIDMTGAKTRLGDFKTSDMEAAGRKIMGDVVKTYHRLVPGQRAVAFCASVAHAEEMAEAFGDGWECIHGSLAKDARRAMVARFTAGETIGLTSVDVISEGFDLPAISAAILLRPTMSLSMHLQQVGRALRPFPGKSVATIIDHAGNLARHGFAETPRNWTLEGDPEQGTKSKTVDIGRRCPECYYINPPGSGQCLDCGHTFEVDREITHVEAEMVEVSTWSEPPKLRPRVLLAMADLGYQYPMLLRQWRDVAERLEYKRGWAWHQFRNQKSNLASSGR